MQALAAAVQGECSIILGYVYVQTNVRVRNADVGAGAGALTELVGNGILHLVCHKLAVAELIGEHHAVHGKGRLRRQILAPVHSLHGFVHVVGRACLEVLNRF